MDRTLILVKPDAFARNLTGEIIARFERKDLKLVALRHMTMSREQHTATLLPSGLVLVAGGLASSVLPFPGLKSSCVSLQ